MRVEGFVFAYDRFRVWDFGFRLQGLECRVQGRRCRASRPSKVMVARAWTAKFEQTLSETVPLSKTGPTLVAGGVA